MLSRTLAIASRGEENVSNDDPLEEEYTSAREGESGESSEEEEDSVL